VSLYRNEGGIFTDVAARTGLAPPTLAPVKWGGGFGDFDNDGWQDVVIADGNFSSRMDNLESEVNLASPFSYSGMFRAVSLPTLRDNPASTMGLPSRAVGRHLET
jgi:hypothetical protein